MGGGQGYGPGRLLGLAVELCHSGVGDYWEDVDLSIRNHGTEYHFTLCDEAGDSPHHAEGAEVVNAL